MVLHSVLFQGSRVPHRLWPSQGTSIVFSVSGCGAECDTDRIHVEKHPPAAWPQECAQVDDQPRQAKSSAQTSEKTFKLRHSQHHVVRFSTWTAWTFKTRQWISSDPVLHAIGVVCLCPDGSNFHFWATRPWDCKICNIFLVSSGRHQGVCDNSAEAR